MESGSRNVTPLRGRTHAGSVCEREGRKERRSLLASDQNVIGSHAVYFPPDREVRRGQFICGGSKAKERAFFLSSFVLGCTFRRV